MANEIKRIYRSKEDKMIAGVCGGIAEYFEIDSVWVRLAAILTVFMNGIGLLLYIVAWIIMPENPNQKDKPKTISERLVSESTKKFKENHKNNKETQKKIEKTVNTREGKFLGGLLIIVGSYFFIERYFPFLNIGNFWPVLIILFGIFLLIRGKKDEKHK